MANLGVDSFTRANQAGFGTASDGQTWAQTVGTSTPSIVSNKGQLTGTSGVNAFFLGSNTYYDFQVKCRLSHSNLQDKSALIARATGNQTYYDAEYTNGSLNINLSNSGTVTTLASFAFSEVAGSSYQLKFLCFGFGTWTNNLFAKIWLDGTTEPANYQVAVSDSTIFGVGKFGVRGKGFASGSILTYDTFSAVDPTTTLPTPANNIVKDLRYGTTTYVNASNGSPILLPQQALTDLQGWGNGAWERNQLPWSTIEQVQGQYLWSVLDDIVARCNIAGINLCFCLQTAPSFYLTIRASDGATVAAGTGDLPNATAMQAYATAVASRYNGTTGHGIIQILQIGNEEWDTQPPRDIQSQWLVPLVNAAGPAIKAAHPNCRVAICAVRKTPTAALDHITNWVTNLLIYQGGCGGNFDIFDPHYYRGGSTAGTDPNTFDSDTPSIAQEISAIRSILNQHGLSNVEIMCGETGWDTYDDGNGIETTLTSALTAGTPYTSLPVAALSDVIPKGTQITIDYNGTHQELATSSAQAAAGAISIPITSFTPAFSHSSGVNIYGMTTTSTVNTATQQSQYLQEMYDAFKANGGGHCFVYTNNTRAVVTNSTSLPQVSTDTKSIVQTISGVYTYLAAYFMTQTYARMGQMTQWYVATTGSDSNPGTQSLPFLTIQKASTVVAPGDTVNVASGTYTLAAGTFIYTHSGNSGSSSAPIIYQSTVKWGAKLVGNQPSGDSGYVWYNESNYIKIVGFDITGIGNATRGGISNYGHDVYVDQCYIHDIPAIPAASGGSGLSHNYAAGLTNCWTTNCVIDRIGMDATTNSQTQGIYHSQPGGGAYNNRVSRCQGWGIHMWHAATGVTVSNNLCYNNDDGGIMNANDGVNAGFNKNQGSIISNNICFNNTSAGGGGGYGLREVNNGAMGANTYTNNCFFGNTGAAFPTSVGSAWSGLTSVTSSVLSNPIFLNYQPDNTGDYHLSPTSPCIGKGSSVGTFTPDFDGNVRPTSANGSYDIGSYQFVQVTIYVATTGSDSNAGTQAHPYLTIQKASTKAAPGAVVHVAAGTYTLASGAFIYIHAANAGSANARVTYVSDTPLGAKIVGNVPSGDGGAVVYFDTAANYNDFIGFDVTGIGNGTRIGIINHGSHNRIINCYVHDIPALPGTSGGAGIDHPDSSTTDNWTIGCVIDHIGSDTNTLVYGIYHNSPSGGAYNNRVSRASAYGLYIAGASFIAANNLVYNCGGTSGGGGAIVAGTISGVFIINNIIIHNMGFGLTESGSPTSNTYTNNCFFANTSGSFSSLGSPMGTFILGDPLLQNYQNDNSGDYHLSSSSPCINAGVSANAPTTDKDGVPRPQGASYDIGPYESILAFVLFPATNRRTGLLPATNRRQSY